MFRRKGCVEREELHLPVVYPLWEDPNLLQVWLNTWHPLPSETIFVVKLKHLLVKCPKFSDETSAVCFCRLGSKLRSQSPGNTRYSPTRYLPKYLTSDRRAEEKTVERETKQQMTDKKTTDNNIVHPAEANVEMSKSGPHKGQVFWESFC